LEILFFFPQTQPTTTITKTIATHCYVKIFMVILVTKIFSLTKETNRNLLYIFFYFHFHIVTWAYVQPPNTQRWHKNLSRILSERTAFFCHRTVLFNAVGSFHLKFFYLKFSDFSKINFPMPRKIFISEYFEWENSNDGILCFQSMKLKISPPQHDRDATCRMPHTTKKTWFSMCEAQQKFLHITQYKKKHNFSVCYIFLSCS